MLERNVFASVSLPPQSPIGAVIVSMDSVRDVVSACAPAAVSAVPCSAAAGACFPRRTGGCCVFLLPCALAPGRIHARAAVGRARPPQAGVRARKAFAGADGVSRLAAALKARTVRPVIGYLLLAWGGWCAPGRPRLFLFDRSARRGLFSLVAAGSTHEPRASAGERGCERSP